jgi:predicted nuclease of predicted toxin-antitoxin system
VTLLLDQNLSPRFVEQLSELYPGIAHVQSVGLDRAPDETVWKYARENDCIIVTKDSDFHERSILFGHPPKVIWIRHGNCSTRQIAQILRDHVTDVQTLAADNESIFLVLI